MTDLDTKFMSRALELAAKGEGLVSPNPLVGAVVVQGNRIVGEGFHRFALVRHAESYALEMAGTQARGATLYCNLEPCCHQGRTPPCTDALIEAGISRVVVATGDPDPRVNHRGLGQLAAAGIDVTVGLMADEASRLNEIYLKHSATGRAFVHLVSCLAPSDSSMSSEGNRTAGVPTGWRPSTALRRLAERYDVLVLGDALPASLAIAKEYIGPPRHRAPIIAGYAALVASVKETLGPERPTGVCFVVLDDLSRQGQEPLTLESQGRGTAVCPGWVPLDRLLDALRGERVTSALVLAGPVSPEADLGPVDRITVVMRPSEATTPEWLGLKGLAPGQGGGIEHGKESDGFVEVSGYLIRH